MSDELNPYTLPEHLHSVIDEAALQEFLELLPPNSRSSFLAAFQEMLDISGAAAGTGKEFGFSAELNDAPVSIRQAFHRIFRRPAHNA